MSAMHWEARRRQSVLDRRMARDKEEMLQGGSKTSCHATESNTAQEQTEKTTVCECRRATDRSAAVGGQCPHCKGELKTPVYHSGKIPNRYSSLQYSQQW